MTGEQRRVERMKLEHMMADFDILELVVDIVIDIKVVDYKVDLVEDIVDIEEVVEINFEEEVLFVDIEVDHLVLYIFAVVNYNY